jgi:hypothetical protein
LSKPATQEYVVNITDNHDRALLAHFCGYPKKAKDFEKTMKNIGADSFRLPCKYESFRKVTLNQLPQNVALWKQYANAADQYSLKQIQVAMKLMELLQIE